ncbi:MAG: alpha/beta hydrolase [Acidimicrobiia bacterium]|nr:alpha/beta hydrolase [Acidimicrobiia bacterium]
MTTTLATHRARLLDGVPLTERRMTLSGLPTAVLEGGSGPPMVLLHGPGESAVNWRWIAGDLVTTHRVVAPDLPAHGSTGSDPDRLDEEGVLEWLDALVERTCGEPAVLVGHVLGGAIATRYAVGNPRRLRALVLVDSLGLGRFRPGIGFASTFARFTARPSERGYERFMNHCAHDLDALRADLGADWPAFVSYNLGLARSETASGARKLFRRVGLPRIDPGDLDRIQVPTVLIWGRHDEALKLKIAEAASERHGWPLHVVEDAADDPPRDQPGAFVRALRGALDATG